MKRLDLIVIGSGPAASTVAKKTAESGKSVALVESRGFGGNCALRGCNPKKVYTTAANLIDRVRRADGKLGRFGPVSIDWPELQAFKSTFTDPVPESSVDSFHRRKIETVEGEAVFTGPGQLEAGGRQLEAHRFFIGVGAVPVPLAFPGSEHVVTSDAFFELREIPEHVTFVGGGFISLEFAHLVARCGSQVVIVDRNRRPLRQFDHDLVAQLMRWSSRIGVGLIPESDVTGIQKKAGTGFRVKISGGGRDQWIDTGLVVHGAGRKPALEGLGLEAAGVTYGDEGIDVDPYFRSISNPAVFAAGDCANTGMPRLTPVANEQARQVVQTLLSGTPSGKADYGIVPQVVFTSPCLAAVGLLEESPEVAGLGDRVDIRFEDTSNWDSVRKSCQECAGYKLLVDRQSDRILGAHLLGPAAAETVNLFALAMKFGLTATNIKSTLFAFPTFASDVRRMV